MKGQRPGESNCEGLCIMKERGSQYVKQLIVNHIMWSQNVS